jgi:ribose transport system substrate-binding protein
MAAANRLTARAVPSNVAAMRSALLSLSLLALWPAAACGGHADDANTLTIAVVPKGTQHEFWKSVHAGALQGARALGVAMEWLGPDPEGDRQAQVHLLQQLVIKGVKGIVLAPIDEQALARPVADAVAAGVPVVVIDSALQGDAHVAYVATDNRAGGELGGRHLAELLGGKGRVAMLRFQQGSASTMAREAGCLAALAAFPDIVVVDSDQYAGDTERAQKTAASLLLAHPDLDGVFCPNESTTHGFLVALQQAGRAGKVKFVGFDSSQPLVNGLEQGHVHGLVLQDPVAMGRLGVEALVAHLRGQPVAKVQHTGLHLATPSNRTDPAFRALLQPDLSILSR